MNSFAKRLVRGTDTPIIINFDFDGEFAENGLNNFTNIEVKIGTETYSTQANPNDIIVQSKTQLRVKVGTLTSLEAGEHSITVTGYTATEYDDGIEVPYFGTVTVV